MKTPHPDEVEALKSEVEDLKTLLRDVLTNAAHQSVTYPIALSLRLSRALDVAPVSTSPHPKDDK